MKSEKMGNILNRPYGYEIAKELIDSEKSFSEIKSGVNANYDAEIDRILTDAKDMGIIKIPPTKGGKKYILNTEQLTESQIEDIEWKADARMDNTPPHMNAEGSRSKWVPKDDDPGKRRSDNNGDDDPVYGRQV